MTPASARRRALPLPLTAVNGRQRPPLGGRSRRPPLPARCRHDAAPARPVPGAGLPAVLAAMARPCAAGGGAGGGGGGGGFPRQPGGPQGGSSSGRGRGRALKDIRVDEEVEIAVSAALERFRYGDEKGARRGTGGGLGTAGATPSCSFFLFIFFCLRDGVPFFLYEHRAGLRAPAVPVARAGIEE